MREVNIMVGGILKLVPLDQLRTRANQIWIGVDYGATFCWTTESHHKWHWVILIQRRRPSCNG